MKNYGKMPAAALLLLTFCLLLMLTGCSDRQDGLPAAEEGTDAAETESAAAGEEIELYYCNEEGTGLLTLTWLATQEDEEAAIREAFDILQNGPFDDGLAAVPDTVQLEHVAWQENCMVLYLTGTYPAAGSARELLCRGALVYTMVQFEDVDGLSIYVNDEALTDANGVEFGILQTDSILLDVEE